MRSPNYGQKTASFLGSLLFLDLDFLKNKTGG